MTDQTTNIEGGMTLTELQSMHSTFVEEMGWRYSKTPLESVALICEEIGELTHELRKKHLDYDACGDELADIILRAIDLAKEMNIDIGAAVECKARKNIANIDAIKAKGRVI